MPHVFLYAILPTFAVLGVAWGLEPNGFPRRFLHAVRDGLRSAGRSFARVAVNVADALGFV